jgi:uncharacterized protein
MDKVVHFEIPADDMARAKKFYRDMFGWELVDIPGMDYVIVHTVAVDKDNMPLESGAINGGITKRIPTEKNPVIVIDVPSIDDYVKKIVKAGGKVVAPKMEMMGMGI